MIEKKRIDRYIILLLFFLMIFNASVSVYAEESDQIITINADENKLYNYISLGGFMEGCFSGDPKTTFSGVSKEVDLMLELNLDQETVTGTVSGSGSDTRYSFTHEYHWDFYGTITGKITQTLSGSSFVYWKWKLSGTADITLNCNAQRRCWNAETLEYITKTDDTQILISANLSGDSYVARTGFSHFSIYWEDYGGLDQKLRLFSIQCGNTTGTGDCELTDELPDPINLSVSLNGPDIIDKGSNSALFKLNPSGRDQDIVNEVWWHFYYKNPEWNPDAIYINEWKWFENYIQDDLTDLIVPKNNISQWMDIVNQYGTTIDGVKQLEFKLEVTVEDENRITLVKNDPIKYILPNITFICKYNGSSSNPIDLPNIFSNLDIPSNIQGILLQGVISAGAGFGLVELIRRLLGKAPKGSKTALDLNRLKEQLEKLPEQPEAGSLESEDMIRLPSEDKYDKQAKRRSTLHYKAWKKKWDDDIFFEKSREQKGWTPKQELEEIKDAKPKWINDFSDFKTYEELQNNRDGIWLDSKKFWDHYNDLSTAEKNSVDNWKRQKKSWMRRHGAGNVGKFSDVGDVIQFTAVAGGRG